MKMINSRYIHKFVDGILVYKKRRDEAKWEVVTSLSDFLDEQLQFTLTRPIAALYYAKRYLEDGRIIHELDKTDQYLKLYCIYTPDETPPEIILPETYTHDKMHFIRLDYSQVTIMTVSSCIPEVPKCSTGL